MTPRLPFGITVRDVLALLLAVAAGALWALGIEAIMLAVLWAKGLL